MSTTRLRVSSYCKLHLIYSYFLLFLWTRFQKEEIKMQLIEIRPLDSKSKFDLNVFVDVMWKLYDQKKYPTWVPPLRLSVLDNLDVVKNPFYRNSDIQLYLALKNSIPVGRIAAIECRPHNHFHQEKIGFYGFFECEDNQETANALFEAAENWARSRGLTALRGPMNPSTNHECGLLVRGQSHHPYVMTTWNPKYYEALHERAHYKGVKDLLGYYIAADQGKDLPPRVVQIAEEARKSSRIIFRDFDIKNFDSEVEKCFEIYNSAWESNWGFFPMTRDEFFHMAKDMKLILDTRFAYIAEVDGKPAGFNLVLPDVNQILKYIPSGKLFPTGIFKLLLGKKLLKTGRCITLGIKPEYRGAGIFALFSYENFRRAKKAGWIGGEASWILEDNEAMNKPWRDLGAPIYKRWRIYEKSLNCDLNHGSEVIESR